MLVPLPPVSRSRSSLFLTSNPDHLPVVRGPDLFWKPPRRRLRLRLEANMSSPSGSSPSGFVAGGGASTDPAPSITSGCPTPLGGGRQPSPPGHPFRRFYDLRTTELHDSGAGGPHQQHPQTKSHAWLETHKPLAHEHAINRKLGYDSRKPDLRGSRVLELHHNQLGTRAG